VSISSVSVLYVETQLGTKVEQDKSNRLRRPMKYHVEVIENMRVGDEPIWRCTHEHKSKASALTCARKELHGENKRWTYVYIVSDTTGSTWAVFNKSVRRIQ